MARTFEYVLHFVSCVTVTVSPNQIIIIIIIIINSIFCIKKLNEIEYIVHHTLYIIHYASNILHIIWGKNLHQN